MYHRQNYQLCKSAFRRVVDSVQAHQTNELINADRMYYIYQSTVNIRISWWKFKLKVAAEKEILILLTSLKKTSTAQQKLGTF